MRMQAVKGHKKAAWGLFALALGGAGAAVAATAYLDFLGKMESGNNPNAQSSTSSAAGQFQMTTGALQATGYINSAGQWTGKDGVNSRAEYLANPTAQYNSMQAYQAQNWQTIQNKGMLQYVGQTVNGVTMNEASLLDCAYVLGAGGCNTYLSTGGQLSEAALAANPNARTAFANRFAQASQTDAGAITNGRNTPVNNAYSPTAPGDANGATGLGGTGGIYCNPDLAQLMVDSGRAAVESQVAMAMNPATGYSLLGGGGVLEAAGLSGGGGGIGSFMQMSCLDNLLDGGLNVIFQPPSLSAIISMLQQAACQQVSRLFAQITQPLNQAIGQTANLGGFLPGLGYLGGGVSVSGGTGGQINVGVREGGSYSGVSAGVGGLLSGDGGWYQGGGAAPKASSNGFRLNNGLFGN